MSEICVNYDELTLAILELHFLEKGTGYSVYSTSNLINHSRGEMYDNINELYAKLMQIEEVLIEIIRRTKIVLNGAGIEFETVENQLISSFKNLVTIPGVLRDIGGLE